jgi:amino acid permease
MIGSSVVTLPWAYSQAGLIMGILIQTISFAISYFTNYLLIKSAGNDVDFTDTLKKHFGINIILII